MNTKRIPIFLSLMFIVCVGLVYLIGSFRPLASDKFANPAPAVNAPPSPFLTDQVVIAPTTQATSALIAPRTAVSIARPRLRRRRNLPLRRILRPHPLRHATHIYRDYTSPAPI